MSASSGKVSVWLLVILLPLGGVSLWYGYRQTHESDAPVLSAMQSQWHFQSEEHWLVDETARDITEMLAFAKDGRADKIEFTTTPETGKRESYTLHAKLDGADVTAQMQWKDYIWSPEEYQPWVKQVVTALKLTTPTTATNDAAIVQALTSPTPEVIHREAERISEALTKAPLDPGLHEQAALLTAAFALREAAGNFGDSRREICRIAAHLAIAEGLQPASDSPVRKFAEAALQTLAGREAPALTALAGLEHNLTPGADAWVRALRLRNTGDWRQEAPKPTLFEQLETFLAREKSVNPEFALTWMEQHKPAPVHDWRRMLLEDDLSVERSHQFAEGSIPQEVISLRADWALFFKGGLANEEIVKALNEPPAHAVAKTKDGRDGISVLGWDFWSAQHQRHLCAAISATVVFLRDKWGVDDYRDAQQFARKNLSNLVLMPILERELTDDKSETPAISQRVSKLLAAHPELVPPAMWGHLLLAGEKTPGLNIESPQAWLHPPLPFGTTYDLCTRSACIHLPGLTDTAWWEAALRIAPEDNDLLFQKLWCQYGNNPPLEVVEKTYAPIKDFNFWALRQIAKRLPNNSPRYVETMQRMCDFEPERYFDLGDYYVKQNQPEQAADAYEKGYNLSADRVFVANSCQWLVNYLDDHGQPEKALAIANDGAVVYSYSGLETMARLQEKHGHLLEAQTGFKNIAERYNDEQPLKAFYWRNRAKDPDFEKTAASLARETFPDGMTKGALVDFKDPPEDGTSLTSSSPSATAAGLKAGDVIVAIDGYRVRTQAQYLFIRGLNDSPELHLIVWDSKHFRAVTATVPGRRFNVKLADYHGVKK